MNDSKYAIGACLGASKNSFVQIKCDASGQILKLLRHLSLISIGKSKNILLIYNKKFDIKKK